MILNAKNGTLQIGKTTMDYISFGKGQRTLIILPGLGDGLRTVKGTAFAFALAYRQYLRDFRVYVFSRKNRLEKGCTTRDMAKDQAEAMKILGIPRADVIGVSQGGMISQYLAIDYPDLVSQLVLTVTLPKANKTIKQVIGNWIKMAESGNYKGIIIDTTEKSYTESYLKKYRPFYPLLVQFGKPKDLNRFLIQANACLNHNAETDLERIQCRTLVIGGDSDKVVGPGSSEELAQMIKNSQLILYKGLGHGAYEEAKAFHRQVIHFLKSEG